MKKRIACLMLALVLIIGLIPVAAVTASAAATGVSEAGVRVIKDFVGFHRNAYEISAGVYRVGYGTSAVQNQTITEANADKLLRAELDKLVKVINSLGIELVQKRFDALVWYSYIEGTAWTTNATVLNAIKSSVAGSGTASEFANTLCTWDYAGGFPDDAGARNVIQRRMAMANLYLTGSYSASSTGSLGYTVFFAGNDQNASFVGGAKRRIQVFSGSYNNKISLSSDPTWSGYTFLGWYDNAALVTGLSAATAGKTLVARWQKSTDDKVAANYTLPAYVIYKAMGIPDNGVVDVYSAAGYPNKIDEIRRDATITVVAEKMIGSAKWLELATGGWVQLCNNLADVPTVIPTTTVTITDDYVTIRKEPNATAAKVGTLKRNQQATIAMLDSTGSWGYCGQGWIFLAYTNYNGTTTTPSNPTLTGGTSGVVSGATQVNVRTAPGVTNPLATKLNQGTKITVYEQTTVNGAPWGHIDQGWIAMAYVTLDKTTQPSGSNISTGSSAVVSSSVSLNVRSGPGSGFSKVATLAPGTSVVIMRKEVVGGVAWGLIDQGWINLNYVSVVSSSNGTGTSTGTGYSVAGTVVNCSTGVNIRSAAGTTNALVGVAALGSRVNVTEIVKVNGFDWGHIERGWVCMDYVKLDSQFTPPSAGTGKDDNASFDNVVSSFQGYPAVTKVAHNLYESASVHVNVLLTINPNQEISITAFQRVNGYIFGKVSIGSKTGWIRMHDENGNATVTMKAFNAKVTAERADVYEQPSTRSKFFAALTKGTYITVAEDASVFTPNTNWALADGAIWGKIVYGTPATNVGWIKLSDVTMFRENSLPVGIASASGVGYMTGSIKNDSVVYVDGNNGVAYETDAAGVSTLKKSNYTLPAGSTINVLGRVYGSKTNSTMTYAKVAVGSVVGWIEWDNNVVLNPVTMKVTTEMNDFTGTRHLPVGTLITIESRKLVYDGNEINHGVHDVGTGYVGDVLTDKVNVVLDQGKLTPVTEAVRNDPSNPAIAASVVVTGTAKANIQVKEEVDDSSKSLLTISGGASVTVLNWKNVNGVTWGKVQINKIVGWIKVSELDFTGLAGKIQVDALNVYSLADKTSTLQVLRVNGMPVSLVGSPVFDGTTVWAQISVAGYTGFVDVQDLKLNTPNVSYEYWNTKVKAKVNSVNVTLNTLDGGQVKELPKGTEVELDNVKMDTTTGKALWHVKLGNDAGWIDMDCLSMYNSTATITGAKADVYNDLNLVAEDILYTLYRGEKVTVINYKVNNVGTAPDYALYGEVICGNTTGWIKLCEATKTENDSMVVSLAPGSSGTTIGGNGNNNNGGSTTPTTAPTTPTTPTATPGYIVCNTTVNVRSGAGVENALVTSLRNGTNVNIYEKVTASNGTLWARIDQGWVCMDYVRTGTLTNVPNGGNNGNSGNVAIITTVPSGAIAVGYANEDVKVRTGTSLGYPEVGTIAKKQSVVIYESKLDGGMSWGRTDNGWVCISYLTITGIGAPGTGSTGTIAGVGFTANVRGSASSGGSLMAKVMITSKVVVRETVTAGAETWVRTDLGWINGQYVMMDSTGTPGATTPDAGTTTPDATTTTVPTTPGEEFVG